MTHLKKTGIPVLSVLLVCFYPCAFLFFQNAGEARAVDMLPFFGIFLLTAAVCLLGFGLLQRNVARAAFLTDVTLLAVIHFTLVLNGIKRLLPWFRGRFFLVLLLAAVLALTVALRRKKPNMTVPCGLIALMFAVMTVMGGITAVPTLVSAATSHRQPTELEQQLAEKMFHGKQRNIYYMIFDEYGGKENLEHYFGYDNEEFFSALEERGFVVSRTSKNTESPWTVTLVPNMLNLHYVTSDQVPINNRLEWLEDPVLYRLFQNNGYDVNLVNHNGFLSETGCHVLTRDQTEETISQYLYENSIFCQIPKLKDLIARKVLHRGENGHLLALDNAATAMRDCWQSARHGPTLTVCYLIAPHAPFLFDQTGTLTQTADYYEWRKPELYLAKLYYINQEILAAVDNIQKNDPEAVILLQADHGARTPGHLVEQFGAPWFDTTVEIPYMENVLNCVYVPDQRVDIEGDTCINATRKTLDAVFGTDLGVLEVPPDYTIPDEYMPPPPDENAPSSEKADDHE